MIDFASLWSATPVPKTPPCDPPRTRDRRVRRLLRGLSTLLPAAVLAACGASPFPGAWPDINARAPQPPPPRARRGPTERQPPPPPALAPLATPQQVVKAVSVGRRDPFGNVLVPTLIQPRESPASITAPSRSPAPPRALAWPKGLAFEGVLQTFSETEAMVSYTPEEAGGSGPSAGSLRVGDTSAEKPGLLPPGWQVAAIDGNRGELVLRKGGETVRKTLETL